uniref:Uncharacterized protein n=1 Tax=Salmonella derby TaxID=28144 RepID=K4KBX4_SALDE|nr:hypothetical protein [Salmonella enterica]AFU91711.1 hypothetical protein pSD107_102 [Salmonella enterica subsp. enterica serovar Derby]
MRKYHMGENRNYHSQRIHYFRCALALIISTQKEKTMNLVDAFVKKVISGPYKEYGKWWIDVEYISWGVPGKTRLMFESKEQALEVKEGYKFLT